MPITKNKDGKSESYEWDGKDFLFSLMGIGLLIFLTLIGFGGCVKLSNDSINNHPSIEAKDK